MSETVGSVPGYFRDMACSLHYLRNHESFTDLTFLCSDGAVHGHKAMLLPHSTILKYLFTVSKSHQASDTTVISLPQVDKIVMIKLLQYVYQGQASFKNNQDRAKVYELAEVLDIDMRFAKEDLEEDHAVASTSKAKKKKGGKKKKQREGKENMATVPVGDLASAFLRKFQDQPQKVSDSQTCEETPIIVTGKRNRISQAVAEDIKIGRKRKVMRYQDSSDDDSEASKNVADIDDDSEEEDGKRISQAKDNGKRRKKEVVKYQDDSEDDRVATNNGLDIDEDSEEEDVEDIVDDVEIDTEMVSLDSDVEECAKKRAAQDNVKVDLKNCGQDKHFKEKVMEIINVENVEVNGSISSESLLDKKDNTKSKEENCEKSGTFDFKDAIDAFIETCKKILPKEEGVRVDLRIKKYMTNLSLQFVSSSFLKVFVETKCALIDSDHDNVWCLIGDVIDELKKHRDANEISNMPNIEKQIDEVENNFEQEREDIERCEIREDSENGNDKTHHLQENMENSDDIVKDLQETVETDDDGAQHLQENIEKDDDLVQDFQEIVENDNGAQDLQENIENDTETSNLHLHMEASKQKAVVLSIDLQNCGKDKSIKEKVMEILNEQTDIDDSDQEDVCGKEENNKEQARALLNDEKAGIDQPTEENSPNVDKNYSDKEDICGDVSDDDNVGSSSIMQINKESENFNDAHLEEEELADRVKKSRRSVTIDKSSTDLKDSNKNLQHDHLDSDREDLDLLSSVREKSKQRAALDNMKVDLVNCSTEEDIKEKVKDMVNYMKNQTDQSMDTEDQYILENESKSGNSSSLTETRNDEKISSDKSKDFDDSNEQAILKVVENDDEMTNNLEKEWKTKAMMDKMKIKISPARHQITSEIARNHDVVVCQLCNRIFLSNKALEKHTKDEDCEEAMEDHNQDGYEVEDADDESDEIEPLNESTPKKFSKRTGPKVGSKRKITVKSYFEKSGDESDSEEEEDTTINKTQGRIQEKRKSAISSDSSESDDLKQKKKRFKRKGSTSSEGDKTSAKKRLGRGSGSTSPAAGDPLSCYNCGKDYKNKIDLKNHILTHFYTELFVLLPASKPFTCPTCSALFRDRISLVRHFAFSHKEIFKYCSEEQLNGGPLKWKRKSLSLEASTSKKDQQSNVSEEDKSNGCNDNESPSTKQSPAKFDMPEASSDSDVDLFLGGKKASDNVKSFDDLLNESGTASKSKPVLKEGSNNDLDAVSQKFLGMDDKDPADVDDLLKESDDESHKS